MALNLTPLPLILSILIMACAYLIKTNGIAIGIMIFILLFISIGAIAGLYCMSMHDIGMDMDMDMGVGGVGIDNAHIVFDIYEIPARYQVQNAGAGAGAGGGAIDVHDHQIQQDLCQSVQRLIKWYSGNTDNLSKEQTFKSIKEYLFGAYDAPPTKKEMAYSTLRQIERINGKIAAFSRTEGELLQMVWQRINDPINREVLSELKDNLLELLADSSITLETPYCLIGRATRIVQALQSLDKEGIVTLKSTELIAKELQGKIPVLRDQFFADHPDLLSDYNNGSDIVAKQLTEFVRDGLHSDYPHADTELNKTIEEHLEALS